MSHKDYQNELVSQLYGVDSRGVLRKRSTDHIPVAVAMETDASKKAAQGHRMGQNLHQADKMRNLF